MSEIKIKKDEQNPEPNEIIADSIIKVAEGFKKINESKLTRRAVLVLLHDAVPSRGYKGKPSKAQIEDILDSAAKLKELYIKKPLKK